MIEKTADGTKSADDGEEKCYYLFCIQFILSIKVKLSIEKLVK